MIAISPELPREKPMTTNLPSPPTARVIGAVNWIGLAALVVKEVRRFLSIWVQTVGAPIVTTLLFLAIFSLALGRAMRIVGGVPFMEFLAPGLIMMAMIQNAFANTSGSIVSSKMQGNIVDMIMAPLTPLELTVGYALGGVLRGVLVGFVVALAMLPFVPLGVHSAGHIIGYAVGGSLMLALLGLIGGIWAQTHEQSAGLTNFVITPLAFLSGTFYSIERLPGLWNVAARMDPFFYLIDGLRYGFIGRAEAPLEIGYAILAGGNFALGLVCWLMFRTGYRLKT
jgi:ABC-2 type transport system permease protein